MLLRKGRQAMKYGFALLLTLILLLGTACTEGRPEDKKVLVTSDRVRAETMYRTWDKNFYEAPSSEAGTVVSLEYTTSQYGEDALHWANVYLPYGYDPEGEQRYPVLYFLHGTNETQDSFIGDERVKNAVDNMIRAGVAPAFIMVMPTYYYDYANRALDVARFVKEVREDLMPAVESTFRTFALTPDAAGFTASRDMRAFAGYSRGGRMTWEMFGTMLDVARWYVPMSGCFSSPEGDPDPDPDRQRARLDQALSSQAEWTDRFFLYVACGGKRDNAFPMVNTLVDLMIGDPDHFSYGRTPGENNLFYCSSNELHQTLIGRYYLYNAFCDGLLR